MKTLASPVGIPRPLPQTLAFHRGDRLFAPDAPAVALRILRGVVRITAPDGAAIRLAQRDEIIGLDGGHFATATALTPVVVAPWAPASAEDAQQTLIAAAHAAEQSAFALNRFNQGRPEKRLLALALFFSERLVDSHDTLSILFPPGADMAQLTGLTREAISRALRHLRDAGLLTPQRIAGIPRPSTYVARSALLHEDVDKLIAPKRRNVGLKGLTSAFAHSIFQPA